MSIDQQLAGDCDKDDLWRLAGIFHALDEVSQTRVALIGFRGGGVGTVTRV